MRVDLGPKTRGLIASVAFALLSVGVFIGVALGRWVFGQ